MNAAIEPVALSVRDACTFSGFGRTMLYEKIGAGEIETRKAGKKTLVLVASLRRAVENLPTGKRR